MSLLADRHALVTGANRGIGAAIARALAAEGANVTLLVRTASKAHAVADALPTKHCVVEADITNAQALQSAIHEAERQLGPIDILVNNAGYAHSGPFLRTDPAKFLEMIQVHLMSVVFASQAVLPGMVERGSGTIINVASIAGMGGIANMAPYIAGKHAQVGITRALAAEFAGKGIRVQAICPGYTETDLVTDALDRISAKTGASREQALEGLLATAHQPRLVTAEEVADATVALITSPPEIGTGLSVMVDGKEEN